MMMRRAWLVWSVLAILACCGAARADKQPVRVACVGDSITFGAAVENREQNCYPAVLGRMLGPGYEVKNFGVSGATLLKAGDKPYWKEGALEAATKFQPQIVIIKLGSNDAKPQNWKHQDQFAADYHALVDHFQALPSQPKVYIALPVAVVKPNFGITEPVVLEQQPILKQVAAEQGVTLIDLHAIVNKPEQFDNDGVHPNAVGAKAIAEAVRVVIGE